MSSDIKYNTDPKHSEYLLKSQKMNLDAGLLGRFFGSPQWAAANIAWITIFLLVCSGIAVVFFGSTIQAAEYWKIIVPIITLALGYLFGRKDKP